jgi:hypothetical protein
MSGNFVFRSHLMCFEEAALNAFYQFAPDEV